MTPQLASWRVIPLQCLPCKAPVVHSSDAPECDAARAQALAADWGAQTLNRGLAGPINADAGLRDWAEGLGPLRQPQPSA